MVVPIDLLKPIYDDMVSYGMPNRPARPWLGLYGTEMENRLVVAGLSEGGPADQGDVQVGDVIAKVGSRQVGSLADFLRQLWSIGPRSEEHTSERQSLMRSSYAVFCLTKKNHTQQPAPYTLTA